MPGALLEAGADAVQGGLSVVGFRLHSTITEHEEGTMIKNFLHLNGVTYELQSPIPSTQDERWGVLQAIVKELVTHGDEPAATFYVIIDGCPVELQVQPGLVFSAGLFLKDEGSSNVW